jgi:putative ABC transport system permease protein
MNCARIVESHAEQLLLTARRRPSMSTLLDDLRYAWRMLWKTRGATAAALVAFALGLGANMAMYSSADALLFRPLLLPDLDRLVTLSSVVNGQIRDDSNISAADYREIREQSRTLVNPVAIMPWWGANLTGAGEPIQVRGCKVTARFFDTLTTTPSHGRTFRADEDTPGRDGVAVLSHGLWQRHFGGDPNVIGRTVRLNDRPYEIIGVMPEDVRYPAVAELWVPLALTPAEWQERSQFNYSVIARLAPGVSLDQASSEIKTITDRIAAEHPQTNLRRYAYVDLVRNVISGGLTRTFSLLLLGVVGFVLIIACANVANLQFARIASRHRELAVRTALGASRWRLIRQLVIEGIVLALLGAGASVLLATWVTDLQQASMPAEVRIFLPGWERMHVNSHAIAYTVLLAAISGIVAGLAAAFGGLRGDVTIALKQAGRTSTGGRGAQRLRGALVLCQVVMALVLLVGAGLMVKGFGGLADPIPGSAPEQVLTMQMALPELRYAQPADRRAFAERALSRLTSLPGARSVTIASTMPYTGEGWGGDFSIEGHPPLTAAERNHTRLISISNCYLATLHIPLVRGREFNSADSDQAPRVAIASEAFVRRFFPEGDVLGRRIKIGAKPDAPWVTIVGVAGDVLYEWVDRGSKVMLYRPFAQAPQGQLRVAIRTTEGADPLALVPAARAAIGAIDPDLPVSEVKTFRTLIENYLIGLRYVAASMGVFGLIALTLSVIGLYSVMAYFVAERSQEFGVRMALGARGVDVLKLVLTRGLTITAIGLAVGLPAAMWMARLLASVFFGVSATDVVALGGGSLLLALTASIACLVPARRATQVDPMRCLRDE